MRAKVAGVVLVTCAILGAGAPAYASRGEHHGGDGHDNGQQGNTYEHSCTSNDHSVVGNVCVIVDDLPILGHILTS
jgi:hypothetical protein